MSVIGVKLSDATASSRNQGRGGGLTINNGTDTMSGMGLSHPLDIPQDLVRVIDQHTWRMEREDWERRNPLIYYFKSCCHLQDDEGNYHWCEGPYAWGLSYVEEPQEPDSDSDAEPRTLIRISGTTYFSEYRDTEVQTARISASDLRRLQTGEVSFQELIKNNLLRPRCPCYYNAVHLAAHAPPCTCPCHVQHCAAY